MYGAFSIIYLSIKISKYNLYLGILISLSINRSKYIVNSCRPCGVWGRTIFFSKE